MAKPRPPKECPFTIVVDCNEYLEHHLGYRFESIDPRPRTVTANLFVGDYGLLGHDGVIVERKSLADLYSSFGKKRENMIERISIMGSRFDFAAMVVEAEYSEVVSRPPRYTKLHPRSLSGAIIALQQRFPRVHWLFMPGRLAGERMTYRILERAYNDKIGGDDATT